MPGGLGPAIKAVLDLDLQGGGPTLFLSVDFVNILQRKGGGLTLMSTKALTKCGCLGMLLHEFKCQDQERGYPGIQKHSQS